jgi:hypothetical protein
MVTMVFQRVGRGFRGRCLAYEIFAEKNYARLEALRQKREAAMLLQRKEKEAATKRAEEEHRGRLEATRAAQSAVAAAESAARGLLEAQYDEFCLDIAARLKRMRQAVLMERAKDRLLKKLQPLAQLFASLTSTIEDQEHEEFAEMAAEAWTERARIQLSEGCLRIEAAEVAQRKALRNEYNALVPRLESERDETMRRIRQCAERESHEEQLRVNRLHREEARRAHHERATTTRRSKVEKVLFNALFRRDRAETGATMVACHNAAASPLPRGMEERLVAHTSRVPKATSLPNEAKDMSPSRSPPGSNETSRSLFLLHGGEPPRMPIRSAEIGMVVFVPRYSQDGTVRATMPGASTPVFLVELACSARRVWLEETDLQEARGPFSVGEGPFVPDDHGSPRGSPAGRQQRHVPAAAARRDHLASAFESWKKDELQRETQNPGISAQRVGFGSWQSMAAMLED